MHLVLDVTVHDRRGRGEPDVRRGLHRLQPLRGVDLARADDVSDLVDELEKRDPSLVEKLYLLEDATSPVVIPEVVDFTEAADEAFDRFEEAGAHRVTTEEPIEHWPQPAPTR